MKQSKKIETRKTLEKILSHDHVNRKIDYFMDLGDTATARKLAFDDYKYWIVESGLKFADDVCKTSVLDKNDISKAVHLAWKSLNKQKNYWNMLGIAKKFKEFKGEKDKIAEAIYLDYLKDGDSVYAANFAKDNGISEDKYKPVYLKWLELNLATCDAEPVIEHMKKFGITKEDLAPLAKKAYHDFMEGNDIRRTNAEGPYMMAVLLSDAAGVKEEYAHHAKEHFKFVLRNGELDRAKKLVNEYNLPSNFVDETALEIMASNKFDGKMRTMRTEEKVKSLRKSFGISVEKIRKRIMPLYNGYVEDRFYNNALSLAENCDLRPANIKKVAEKELLDCVGTGDYTGAMNIAKKYELANYVAAISQYTAIMSKAKALR